jgi:hypothetical protein
MISTMTSRSSAPPAAGGAAEQQDPQVQEALQAARAWLETFRRQPREMSAALQTAADKLQAIRDTSGSAGQAQWRLARLRAELLRADNAADIFWNSVDRLAAARRAKP